MSEKLICWYTCSGCFKDVSHCNAPSKNCRVEKRCQMRRLRKVSNNTFNLSKVKMFMKCMHPLCHDCSMCEQCKGIIERKKIVMDLEDLINYDLSDDDDTLC